MDSKVVLKIKPLRQLSPVFATPGPGYNSGFPFLAPGNTNTSNVSQFYPFYDPMQPQRPCEHTQTDMSNGHVNANEVNDAFPSTDEVPPQSPPFSVEPHFSEVTLNPMMDNDHQPSRKYAKTTVSIGIGKKDVHNDVTWTEAEKWEAVQPLRSVRGDGTIPNSYEYGGYGAGESSTPILKHKEKTVAGADDGQSQGFSSKKVKSVKVPNLLGDGDRESVRKLFMKYDATKRRISQLAEARNLSKAAMDRPDSKAGKIIREKGLRLNEIKRVGTVPGVEVGDIFYFRMDMCVVGLHHQTMSGIDFIIDVKKSEEGTKAVSIVYSGGEYDNEVHEKDYLVYSGQGAKGHQKLERGNLALMNSIRIGNVVRVTRGLTDPAKKEQRIYVYDGLYKATESSTVKNAEGFNIFKFTLERLPGQPEAFGVWKAVEEWRTGVTLRPGMILKDLTFGAERVPVALVNEVDDEQGSPATFKYVATPTYSNEASSSSSHCGCLGSCLPSDPNCLCVVRNDGNLPYTGVNRVLVIQKPLIYECGPNCCCSSECRNRVSQLGLKVRLEVFKTEDRGWGLRTWDPIRAGTFICEYAGEVVDQQKTDKVGVGEDDGVDNYTFTFNGLDNCKSTDWNYDPLLLEEGDLPKSSTEALQVSVTINAKNKGNVARFMNHSCCPNTIWQAVLYDHRDTSRPHIMFYAKNNIPPMTELTFDYGRPGTSFGRKEKQCLCGSLKCRCLYG